MLLIGREVARSLSHVCSLGLEIIGKLWEINDAFSMGNSSQQIQHYNIMLLFYGAALHY